MNVSDPPFPFDNVISNEYVHAMVRVQVIVYVKDFDNSIVSSRVMVFVSVCVSVSVSSSHDREKVCVLSELRVLV